MSESMTIPDGLTCGDCRMFRRCHGIIGVESCNTECDFFPIKFIQSLNESGITGTAAALALNARVAELEAENAALKARVTWKRALKVQPPLEKKLIVNCYFQGIIRACFEMVDGKLYYHKPTENYWSPVTSETYWIDMPDMPVDVEVKNV